MSAAWVTVTLLALGTAAIRTSGPLALGGRALPAQALALVSSLAPALLAALVVTSTFADDRALVLDERALGLAAGAIALRLGLPLVGVIALAAAVTAAARALG